MNSMLHLQMTLVDTFNYGPEASDYSFSGDDVTSQALYPPTQFYIGDGTEGTVDTVYVSFCLYFVLYIKILKMPRALKFDVKIK